MTDRTSACVRTTLGAAAPGAGGRAPGGSLERVRRAASVLSVLVACSACGSTAEEPAAPPVLTADRPVRATTSDLVEVDVHATAPLHLGENTLVVTFPGGGSELAAASALMPAHGHGSPAPTIQRDGEAFIVRDLVLFMSGRWELRLTLTTRGGRDEAVIALDVP